MRRSLEAAQHLAEHGSLTTINGLPACFYCGAFKGREEHHSRCLGLALPEIIADLRRLDAACGAPIDGGVWHCDRCGSEGHVAGTRLCEMLRLQAELDRIVSGLPWWLQMQPTGALMLYVRTMGGLARWLSRAGSFISRCCAQPGAGRPSERR